MVHRNSNFQTLCIRKLVCVTLEASSSRLENFIIFYQKYDYFGDFTLNTRIRWFSSNLGVDRATSQLVLARLEPDFDGSARLVVQYLARPSRFFDGLIWLEPKSCSSLARRAKTSCYNKSIPTKNMAEIWIFCGFILKLEKKSFLKIILSHFGLFF